MKLIRMYRKFSLITIYIVGKCKNEETKVLCKTIYFNKPIERMDKNNQSNLTNLEYSAKL